MSTPAANLKLKQPQVGYLAPGFRPARAFERRWKITPWSTRWSRLKIGLIFYSLAIGVASLGTYTTYRMGKRPHTTTPEWEAASEEYSKFQNMEPFGTLGRKAYTPSYMQPPTEKEIERIKKYG